MKRGMKLRTRLFLLVGGLFILTMTAVAIVRQLQMERSLKSAAVAIHQEIHNFNMQEWGDYLAFLGVEMMKVELHINSLFQRIVEFDWLEVKYEPSESNFRTNDWSNSAVLMISNQWIDFLQTTNRGKLTSRIEMRPPFLQNFKQVDLHKGVTVIIGKRNGRLEGFIGVPFWSNEANANIEVGLHEMQYSATQYDNHWLLFTADQLNSLDTSKLKWQGTQMPTGPLEPSYDIRGEKVFEQLVAVTIEAIKEAQAALRQHPDLVDILNAPTLSAAWLQEHVGDYKFDNPPVPSPYCESYVCNRFRYLEGDWYRLWNWTERVDQNRLVWELATITGSGLWGYDPLNVDAPKGIVCFSSSKKENKDIGYGICSCEVFYDEAIPVDANCDVVDIEGRMDTCISDEMQVYMAKDSSAVYLLNSMIFEDIRVKGPTPVTGTLTIGSDITPSLKVLAMLSPDQVYFVTNDGGQIMFDTNGNEEEISRWGDINYQEMIQKKEGMIRDKTGKEYHYVYVNALTAKDGHVFMIQDRDSEVFMVGQLNKGVEILDKRIMIQYILISFVALIIALFVLNHIINTITRPIRKLAMATKLVAAGNYEQIEIEPNVKDKKGEIKQLLEAFRQMVQDLKRGAEVRSILDKVVSKEIAEKILSEGIALGGEQREVTILFSDMRNFTHIAENMQPQEILEMLNGSLSILSKVIDDNEGVIDKYVGDEIMALYGAPIECKNSALKAIESAKSMRAVQSEWNKQREQAGLPPLHIGIGIHTGIVVAGNVGAENHRSYTVLGHNVNLTSRICDQAGPMEILITEAVLNAPGVKENIQVAPMEPVSLKGVSEPIKLFKVL